MKKITFFSMCILLIGISTFFGCKKELDNISGPHKFSFRESARFNDILDSIGIIHNQALSFSLDKITTQNLFAGLDSAQAIGLVSDLTSEYLNSYLASVPFYYDSTLTDSILYSVLFSSGDPVTEFSSIYQERIAEFLSVLDTSTSPHDFSSYASFFLASTLDSIPAGEQAIYKASILIAHNSFEYWANYQQDWLNEYADQNNLNPAALPAFDVGSCVDADKDGAITGGIDGIRRGGLRNIITRALWGAVVGSGINAINQLLNN